MGVKMSKKEEPMTIGDSFKQANLSNLSDGFYEAQLSDKHQFVSEQPTPQDVVKSRNGFDYVDEGYMRWRLNQHYPIWSWEIIKYETLGDKAIATPTYDFHIRNDAAATVAINEVGIFFSIASSGYSLRTSSIAAMKSFVFFISAIVIPINKNTLTIPSPKCFINSRIWIISSFCRC